MAGRTIGIIDGRADTEAGPDASLVHLRCTAADALSNLVGVLELAADGQVRCSAATRRPFAATLALVDDALVAGDYYEGEPIASFAWPLLLQVGGLARRAGTALELTSRGRAALARPSYAALGALWDKWLTERVARRAVPDRGDQGTTPVRHPDPGRHTPRRCGRGARRPPAGRVDPGPPRCCRSCGPGRRGWR